MPQMNGKELNEHLRASCPAIQVLYMSGYTDHQVIERGLLDAKTAFIQKPFSTSEFTEKVQQLLPAPLALVS